MPRLGPLERYRPLVDRWPELAAAAVRPLPACVWANRLRIEPAALAERLAAAGLAPQPLAWWGDAFRLASGDGLGNRLELVAGLGHLQEEVSMLPARLLAPRPGMRVLDLCAAPGNKTAQMAVAMRNRGTLVANDRDARRVGPLRRALDRLGVWNTVLTVHDAAGYPSAAGLFDRVLADVPCSCEGTSRKNPEVLGRAMTDRARLVRVQGAILATAVRLCRPGGRVVYATCTYAPEENEGVVDGALATAGGELTLRRVRLPGLRTEPGLSAWEGRRFDRRLRRAVRLWPHHNDTGGFFVAVLEKAAAAAGGAAAAAAPGTLPGTLADPLERLAPLLARFGIPRRRLAGLELVPRGRKRLAVYPAGLAPPLEPQPLTVGMPALRADMRHPKLSTAAAMALGRWAQRNRVALTRAQTDAYLTRREVVAGAEQLAACTGTGQVLVVCEDAVLGVGVLRPAAGGGGRIESLFPKGWALAEGRSAFRC